MAPVGCAWGATDEAVVDPAAPVKATTTAPVGPTKNSMAPAGQACPVAERPTPDSGREPVDAGPDCAKRLRISASQTPQGLIPWPAPPPGILRWPALPPLLAQHQTADRRAFWLLSWPAPMAMPHAGPLPLCDPLLLWPALQQSLNIGMGQQGTVADWPALPFRFLRLRLPIPCKRPPMPLEWHGRPLHRQQRRWGRQWGLRSPKRLRPPQLLGPRL